MNENNNPYNPEPAAPRAPQNAQPPQSPVYYAAPPANNRQPVRQAPAQPDTAQRQTPAAAKKNNNSANTFGIFSFIIGCVLMLIIPMIFFNFRSSWAEKYKYAMSWSLVGGLPALIFGVVALMKKSKNKLLPILGIAFAVILMLCAFVTYFIVMNTTDEMVFRVGLF